MEDLLDGLNNEQKTAVIHKDGPLLIIAGAGTGKTLVITKRIAHIISKKWAKPSEILALTFTEKAASEMEERVDKLVPYGFVDTQISTFHAFGDKLLRDFSIDLGLPANFKILSSAEQAIFLRENLFSFDLSYYRPVSNPLSHIEEFIKHFSRLKDELITPDTYIEYAKKRLGLIKEPEEKVEAEKQLELAGAYKRYHELMIQEGNLDYGDQIYLAYKLLSENPSVLKKVQEQYKFILVDEFQDTNFAQYQLVKLIAKKNKNITVVGDDDQSIYRFRGASISNILSFKKDYPDMKQVVLNENYRSTQEILDSSYKLIRHNDPDRLEVQNKINKKLKAQKRGDMPELLSGESLSDEADLVANKILEIKKTKNLKFRDFAILTRANSHLDPFIASLNYKKIPFAFAGASSLFGQTEIKTLIAFLKCLAYEEDNLSFFMLARSNIYRVDDSVLSKFYAQTKRENRSYIELHEQSKDEELAEIVEDIKKYRDLSKDNSAGEILYDFLKEKKVFKELISLGSVEAEVKISNIAKFFEKITQFDRTSHDKSVLAFLENLELIMSVSDEVSVSDIDPDLDVVNLMTVHSSKGLEWPVVFVCNMVNERFPTRRQTEKLPIPEDLVKERLPEGDFHLQEERRLFYVAATRAKNNLFLTWAVDYGGKRAKKISPFVMELMDDPQISASRHKLSPMEKIERFKQIDKPPLIKRKTSGELIRLSRQQIDDYYTCPFKYYLASVIRVPLPGNWHFMYGTAIHEAIGRYYARKLKGEKPALQSLVEDFEQAFRSEGFITRSHEEERKRKGLETLSRFYDEDQKINFMPDAIEESFEFRVGKVIVNGRYDMVLKGENGEIIDFKTSDVDDQKEADRRVRESTQMKIYALAWRDKFNKVPKTTLVFIESDLRSGKVFKDSELEKTEELVIEVAKGIEENNYKPKPDKRQCNYCPYKDSCEDSLA
jgi:DNA helicase-2/ATP-dependent DNA helicase PcrA